MLKDNPNSRRIRIMIHLLKEMGAEQIDYLSSDDDLDSSSNSDESLSD